MSDLYSYITQWIYRFDWMTVIYSHNSVNIGLLMSDLFSKDLDLTEWLSYTVIIQEIVGLDWNWLYLTYISINTPLN